MVSSISAFCKKNLFPIATELFLLNVNLVQGNPNFSAPIELINLLKFYLSLSPFSYVSLNRWFKLLTVFLHNFNNYALFGFSILFHFHLYYTIFFLHVK